MKLKMVSAWTYTKSIFTFPKNVFLLFGLALLLILGFSIPVNFTPLAKPAIAQVSPLPTNLSRYTVTAEFGQDRPGSDYRSFQLNSAAASVCQQSCINDNQCVAYTYVRPGVQGNRAVCYLKSVAPAQSSNSCCVSGVKL